MSQLAGDATAQSVSEAEAWFRLRSYLETGRGRGRPIKDEVEFRKALAVAVQILGERVTAAVAETSKARGRPYDYTAYAGDDCGEK